MSLRTYVLTNKKRFAYLQVKRNHRWAQSQVIRCVIYVIRYDRNLERKKLTLSGTSREMRWKRRGWAWGAGSRWRVKTWALQSVCCIKRRVCPSVTAWPWTSLWSECSCPPTPPPKSLYGEILVPKNDIWRWVVREVRRSWGWNPHKWDYCCHKRGSWEASRLSALWGHSEAVPAVNP